jgi:hypothetical protein
LDTQFREQNTIYTLELANIDLNDHEDYWQFLVVTAGQDGLFHYHLFSHILEGLRSLHHRNADETLPRKPGMTDYALDMRVVSCVRITCPENIRTEYLAIIPRIARELPSRLDGSETSQIVLSHGSYGGGGMRELLHKLTINGLKFDELKQYFNLMN